MQKKPVVRMTPEQCELAGAHVGICYDVARRYHDYNEDLLDVGFLALCEAAQCYCEEKSNGKSFGTFAWRIVWNRVRDYVRGEGRECRNNHRIAIYLDSIPKLHKVEEDESYYDQIPDKTDVDKIVESADLLNDVWEYMNPSERQVAFLLSIGYNHQEVGDILGHTKRYADNTICKLRTRLMEILPEEVNRRKGQYVRSCGSVQQGA